MEDYDVSDSLRKLGESWKGKYLERKTAYERLYQTILWLTDDKRLPKDLKDEFIAKLTATIARERIEIERVS